MITASDMAWLAGLLDVKYATLHRANTQDEERKVVLNIWDKDFDVLERAAKLAGSNITPREGRPYPEWMQRACGEHCQEKHVHRTLPPKHNWKIYGISAIIVFYNVMPYMVHALDIGVTQKLDQTLAQTKFSGTGSINTRVICNKLSALGWKIPPEIESQLAGKSHGTAKTKKVTAQAPVA